MLVVEDDADIRELIAMYLQDHQFHIIEAGDGEAALRQFQKYRQRSGQNENLHPDAALVHWPFWQDVRAELNKLEKVEKKWFAELIREGMERGEIRPGDSEQLAMVLLCLLDGFFWGQQLYDEQAFMARFD